MQDHNLDDLIVDTIHPKNSKTKSFLTIIALAIVVLIIAIILTKIILKNPNEPALLEDNNTVLVSPDLTLQAATEEEAVKKPLIPTTENIKPDIHTESDTKAATPTTHLNVDTTQEKSTTETVKITNEFAESETQKIKEEAARKAEKEKELQRQKKIEKEKELQRQREVQREKNLAKKREAARLAEERAKKSVDNETTGHPYFIQVGSFTKTPSERFLAVIKNSGFSYQITAPSSNGTKKLLVGPYSTKTQVDSALIKVKDRINKSAYIIRK